MSDQGQQEYDQTFVDVLELVWGEGYLSPGGPEEVTAVIGDVSLAGKAILDIGCGSGGIGRLLVEKFDAEHVTGIDVEQSLIETCNSRKSGTDLESRLDYIRVEPGPLPFADRTFDVVFTKDSLIHIEDKNAICSEVFRVLRSGGLFLASDWMRSDGPVSDILQRYIDLEDLGFGMGGQGDYKRALEAAGFDSIRFTDRNAWYRRIARDELRLLSVDAYDRLVEIAGKEMADHEVMIWEAMIEALDAGDLRPTHWYAEKP